MNDKLPIFKYHSDPIQSGVFAPSSKCCPVCNKNNEIEYIGPFYSTYEIDGICPWCIANGKAAEKYDLTFIDEDEIEKVNDDFLTEELTKRTPGFFFPQEDAWPSHCDDYCVLLGGVGAKYIESKINLLKADLELIRNQLEITDDVLKADLIRKNSPLWVGLFQCDNCKSYRLVADYE